MKKFLENLNKYWVTPAVAIVGALLGLYFTLVKNNLETEAAKISNSAAKIEAEIKQKEFSNNVKIQMYSEVKEAIMSDDNKLQDAVLLLVNEMLADDSLFREQLIRILIASPNVDNSVKLKQKEIEVQTKEFIQKEKSKLAGNFTVDVFYLEDILNEAKPRADKITQLLNDKFPDYRIRTRVLPRTVNAKSGYRISSNQIRFEKDERKEAEQILELIKKKGIFQLEQPELLEINPTTKTPDYMSIFVRNM
ncbi:hypothetical protein ACE1ET_12995 [Saccharicrinis sp. FJH62]|uniref:hypothetical protein n=1 Tax=Saccharicrinis sp. FJH62 TaxID=3344657 RepID=UPI0035D4E49C